MAGGPKAPVGGGGKLAIYTITTNNFVTTPAFTFDKIVTTGITGHPKMKNVSIDLDHKVNDDAYLTFLDTYVSAVSTEATKQQYENGEEDIISAGGEAATTFGWIYLEAALGGKKTVHAGIGYLGANAGNMSTGVGALTNTPAQIVSKIPDTATTISDTIFTALGVTSGTVTLAITTAGTRFRAATT